MKTNPERLSRSAAAFREVAQTPEGATSIAGDARSLMVTIARECLSIPPENFWAVFEIYYGDLGISLVLTQVAWDGGIRPSELAGVLGISERALRDRLRNPHLTLLLNWVGDVRDGRRRLFRIRQPADAFGLMPTDVSDAVEEVATSLAHVEWPHPSTWVDGILEEVQATLTLERVEAWLELAPLVLSRFIAVGKRLHAVMGKWPENRAKQELLWRLLERMNDVRVLLEEEETRRELASLLSADLEGLLMAFRGITAQDAAGRDIARGVLALMILIDAEVGSHGE